MKHLLPSIILGLILVGSITITLTLNQKGGVVLTSLQKPALNPGQKPFTFKAKEIEHISFHSSKESFKLSREESAWAINTETNKRADYQKIKKILYAFETAEIIQALPSFNSSKSQTRIQLKSNTETHSFTFHSNLSRYANTEKEEPYYSLELEDGLTYVVKSALGEPLPEITESNLTDKHPFFFHPNFVKNLTINKEGQSVTVSRQNPESNWEITSPLKLKADQKIVNALLGDLYHLNAETVHSDQTDSTPNTSISISSFHSHFPKETLYIDLENATGFTPFTQKKYAFDSSQITPLLLSADNLRSRIPMELDINNLDYIILQSKYQSYPLTLAIQPNSSGLPRWVYQTANEWKIADERKVADLISAFTKDNVAGFSLKTLSSNQEANKSVTFGFKDKTNTTYHLFQDSSDTLLQNKKDPASFILSPSHASKIRTAPIDWKDTSLWNLSLIHLKGLQRKRLNHPIENYSYNYNLELWKGQVGSARVDDEIDPINANSYVDFLENLQILHWVPNNSALLENPALVNVFELTALSEQVSEMGDFKGVKKDKLTIFRSSNQTSLLVRLEENENISFGILDATSFERLNDELLYKN